MYAEMSFSFRFICTGPTKNWIAVEGSPSHSGTTDSIPLANYSYKIASSAPRGPQSTDERNVFAIYVSYYIKVKLALSGMGGEVTLKLPFILGHIDDSLDDDNPDHDDAIVTKKLDNENDDELNAKATANEDATRIGDENSCKKNCRNDDETGANGMKTIENNGLSIDVIVEGLSDRKNNEIKGVDALECSSRMMGNNCNETERNINVVTAQIHSSGI